MEGENVVLPTTEAGLEPLHFLKSTDPPLWLAPSPSLSKFTRLASQNLFSILKPFSPKSPFDHLLVDGFDAEQIWQQIDLQSQPLLASVRRDLKRFEKNPEEIANLKVALEDKKKVIQEMAKGMAKESERLEEDIMEYDEEEDEDEDDEEEGEENYDDEEDEVTEEGEKEEGDDEDEGDESSGGIEDEFLKMKELEKFMKEAEVREYGLPQKKDGKKEKRQKKKEEESEDDEDEEDEDDELGGFGLHGEKDDDASELEKARYDDFFGTKKKSPGRRKPKLTDGSGSELSDSSDEEEDNGAHVEQMSKNLSTHQKQLKKLQSEIEVMEKANLEQKTWTMQGEVTAAKRPKNSALEVDLDFEHNVRPAPVITEEVTATLEEMIQKRIREGRFDEVQKAPKRPTKAPREMKDLDENKSKKGLGEIYEEEYVEKTNLAAAPSSLSDETKKEATLLFQKLCSKLDALSHYHYAPKPVIEDMSISVNVPALAMEEVAPVAVSDAAMLAPEEVFSGKGDIKEAAELSQSDRKRKRASKKRRYKAMVAKRDANKPKNTTIPVPNEAK